MQKGKITFFRGTHGYISSPKFRYNLYFTKSDIRTGGRQWLKRGDEVEFRVIPDPKIKGKFRAVSVFYTGYKPFTLAELKVSVNLNDLVIGQLNSWNGMKGMISSSLLHEKDTFLYYTRVANAEVKKGQIIVFHPVQSKDPRSPYFAYFAYAIEQEKPDVLLQIYANDGKNGYPELESFLKIHFHKEWLSQRIKWSAEDEWRESERFLQEYKRSYDSLSKELVEQLPPDFQIYVWEKNYTQHINSTLLNKYFISSDKDLKAYLLSKVTSEQKQELINSYITWFIGHEKYRSVNSYLKPLIGLLKESDPTSLSIIVEIIFENLDDVTLIDLWIENYLDQLPGRIDVASIILNGSLQTFKAFLAKPISPDETQIYTTLKNKLLLSGKKAPESAQIERIALLLKALHKSDNIAYHRDILPLLKEQFDYDTLLLLDALAVNIDSLLSAPDPLLPKNTNIITLILGDVAEKRAFNPITYHDTPLLAQHIVDDICRFTWTEELNPASFLREQYATWHKKHSKSSPTPEDLVVPIFNQLKPANSAHHIRLYLAFFENLKHQNVYYEFSTSFKQLNSQEKRQFRSHLLRVMEHENNQVEREVVIPCTKVEQIDPSTSVYRATCENIYFSDGTFQLKLANGAYTLDKKADLVSTGFNFIKSSSEEGKVVITIKVQNNEIVEVDGLNQVIDIVFKKHTRAVLAAFSEKTSLSKPNETTSYVQDLDLKKQILSYLETEQMVNTKPILLHEYGTALKRLKKAPIGSEGSASLNLGKLFSIAANNEIIIIWENIEPSETLSTYVFKTPEALYNQQIERIQTAVSSYKNLRTYLTNSFTTDARQGDKLEKQAEWHQYLGYIGNIKKRRGQKEAFLNWERKLKEIIKTPIPDIENAREPDIDETENTFGVVVKVSTPSKRKPISRDKKVKNFTDEQISGLDIFGESEPSPANDQVPDNPYTEIYTTLQMLNQHFLLNL